MEKHSIGSFGNFGRNKLKQYQLMWLFWSTVGQTKNSTDESWSTILGFRGILGRLEVRKRSFKQQ